MLWLRPSAAGIWIWLRVHYDCLLKAEDANLSKVADDFEQAVEVMTKSFSRSDYLQTLQIVPNIADMMAC